MKIFHGYVHGFFIIIIRVSHGLLSSSAGAMLLCLNLITITNIKYTVLYNITLLILYYFFIIITTLWILEVCCYMCCHWWTFWTTPRPPLTTNLALNYLYCFIVYLAHVISFNNYLIKAFGLFFIFGSNCIGHTHFYNYHTCNCWQVKYHHHIYSCSKGVLLYSRTSIIQTSMFQLILRLHLMPHASSVWQDLSQLPPWS